MEFRIDHKIDHRRRSSGHGLGSASPAQKLKYQYNKSDDEQKVDEAAANRHDKGAQCPQHEQDCNYGPEHDRSPFLYGEK
jgi:hypothetical protein